MSSANVLANDAEACWKPVTTAPLYTMNDRRDRGVDTYSHLTAIDKSNTYLKRKAYRVAELEGKNMSPEARRQPITVAGGPGCSGRM
jgi:hypothetical protein